MMQCFLDIDNTLLDSQYRINSFDFSKKIKKYTQNGWYFHLNSNRAIEDMLPLYTNLALNGWLVCENGSFGYQPDEKKIINIASINLLKLIELEKAKLPIRINGVFDSLKIGKIQWITTDTVVMLSSKERIKELQSINNDYLLLNNCYRKYSASIHIRKGSNIGKPISFRLGDKIADELRVIYKKENLPLSVIFSHTHGNLLINLDSVNKRDGVEWIKKNFNGRLCAIGDELSDYKMIAGLGDFYTTANAPVETQKNAILVSKKEYAAGVLELISEINSK